MTGTVFAQQQPMTWADVFPRPAITLAAHTKPTVRDSPKNYNFGGQTILRDEGGLTYMLTDYLGFTVAITNNLGTLISEQRYLPFEQVREQIGASPGIPETDMGYTGQRSLDSGMGGLMDYKARFYSPCIRI